MKRVRFKANIKNQSKSIFMKNPPENKEEIKKKFQFPNLSKMSIQFD